jgi:HPt (histidine-containing phosphotransfer) domain-containing protein
LAGFDLISGLDRLGGNKGLYRKLLLDFAVKYRGIAGEIRKALVEKDLAQAHSLVHNLKGLAGNLSALDLLKATIGLEKLVKGESAENVSDKERFEKFGDLEVALNQALESAGTLGLTAPDQTTESSPGKKAAVPQALAKEAAERIGAAADMGDVQNIKAITEALMSREEAFVPLGEKIMALADDFDFDMIQETLRELKE